MPDFLMFPMPPLPPECAQKRVQKPSKKRSRSIHNHVICLTVSPLRQELNRLNSQADCRSGYQTDLPIFRSSPHLRPKYPEGQKHQNIFQHICLGLGCVPPGIQKSQINPGSGSWGSGEKCHPRSHISIQKEQKCRNHLLFPFFSHLSAHNRQYPCQNQSRNHSADHITHRLCKVFFHAEKYCPDIIHSVIFCLRQNAGSSIPFLSCLYGSRAPGPLILAPSDVSETDSASEACTVSEVCSVSVPAVSVSGTFVSGISISCSSAASLSAPSV